MEVKSLPQESEMHSREMKRILATEGTTIPYLKQRECVCVCVWSASAFLCPLQPKIGAGSWF